MSAPAAVLLAGTILALVASLAAWWRWAVTADLYTGHVMIPGRPTAEDHRPGRAVVAGAYAEALAAARRTSTGRLRTAERRLRRRYARQPLTADALVRLAAARAVLDERGVALHPLPGRRTGVAR